jgi:hypothetical protein
MGVAMTTYSIFIDDDRYSTPTLQFVVGGSETAAFDFAMKYLLDSPHHQSVRVDRDGAEVFVKRRLDLTAGASDPRRA